MAEKEVHFELVSSRNMYRDRAVVQLQVAEADLESIAELLNGSWLAWLDVHLVTEASTSPAPRAAPREDV
jgi:hypothetical protein